MTRRRDPIAQVRSVMYRGARGLGDIQAVRKAAGTHSIAPIEKRIERRVLGRLAGRIIRGLTR